MFGDLRKKRSVMNKFHPMVGKGWSGLHDAGLNPAGHGINDGVIHQAQYLDELQLTPLNCAQPTINDEEIFHRALW